MSFHASRCRAAAYASFGPQVDPSVTPFDFTLFFQESILTIGPAALLLLIVPWRIRYLRKCPRRVVAVHFRNIKVVCIHPIDTFKLRTLTNSRPLLQF